MGENHILSVRAPLRAPLSFPSFCAHTACIAPTRVCALRAIACHRMSLACTPALGVVCTGSRTHFSEHRVVVVALSMSPVAGEVRAPANGAAQLDAVLRAIRVDIKERPREWLAGDVATDMPRGSGRLMLNVPRTKVPPQPPSHRTAAAAHDVAHDLWVISIPHSSSLFASRCITLSSLARRCL